MALESLAQRMRSSPFFMDMDPCEPMAYRRMQVHISEPREKELGLFTNHFKVEIKRGYFFHYRVTFSYEDGSVVKDRGVGRKIMDRVQETYSELVGDSAYDGEKSLFTLDLLPQPKLEFTVVLEDITFNRNNSNCRPGSTPNENLKKRLRLPNRFKVEINYTTSIPIPNSFDVGDMKKYEGPLTVLDTVLRGYLPVGRSYFHNGPKSFTTIGGGVLGCRGFNSRFRTTQRGFSLNIDASPTMIVQPGPVVDFLMANQNVQDLFSIDWTKAERMLKNLRVQTSSGNQEDKITSLSDLSCKEQTFSLKYKNGKDGEDVTVYDYFVNHRKIELRYSGDLPCINVGKPERPIFFPLELCSLVSLQRNTMKPQEMMGVLSDALKYNKYDSAPMFPRCGVSIDSGLTRVDGCVLQAPKLLFGDGEEIPINGRWNLNNKTVVMPSYFSRWAVVNFSAYRDTDQLVQNLVKCGNMKGVMIGEPFHVFHEDESCKTLSPVERVEKMYNHMSLDERPDFLLCLLPEPKNSDLYGPWKQRSLFLGFVTQCISPRIANDQYLTNVLMKINVKRGGLNSILSVENKLTSSMASFDSTMILGMTVSHGLRKQHSIAAAVSSRKWPLMSQYRASVCIQTSKGEIIDNLFKTESDNDEGIFRGLLWDFCATNMFMPEIIVIFRDGVSESQLHKVLSIELDQITKACVSLEHYWKPYFVVIVAQKNHHTKFFQASSHDNVPPGTVVDNVICRPGTKDFYLCAHAGMIGTTRPTYYRVLLDETKCPPRHLQEFVHSLHYVDQRSTRAVSVVAPLRHARRAANQMREICSSFKNADDASELIRRVNLNCVTSKFFY